MVACEKATFGRKVFYSIALACFSQAKAKELSVQFAQTTQQLEELKAKQKALEERNRVLEKLMLLNEQQQSGQHDGSQTVPVFSTVLLVAAVPAALSDLTLFGISAVIARHDRRLWHSALECCQHG